jgi:hypothetical protein
MGWWKRHTIMYKVGTETEMRYHFVQIGHRERNEVPFCTKWVQRDKWATISHEIGTETEMRYHFVQSGHRERNEVPFCTKWVPRQKWDTILYKVGTEIQMSYHFVRNGHKEKNDTILHKVGIQTEMTHNSLHIICIAIILHRVNADLYAKEIRFCTEYRQHNNLLLEGMHHLVLQNKKYIYKQTVMQL